MDRQRREVHLVAQHTLLAEQRLQLRFAPGQLALHQRQLRHVAGLRQQPANPNHAGPERGDAALDVDDLGRDVPGLDLLFSDVAELGYRSPHAVESVRRDPDGQVDFLVARPHLLVGDKPAGVRG